MTETTKPAAGTPSAVTPPAPPVPVVMLSAVDAARERDMEAMRARQAAQDSQRAAAALVTMIANVGFTLITDEAPDGVVVRPGQEFEVPACDVGAWLGRARLPDNEDDAPARGASVTPA